MVNLWKSRGTLAMHDTHDACGGDVTGLEEESMMESLTLEQLFQRLQ